MNDLGFYEKHVLVNLLVRVAKSSKWRIEHNCTFDDDKRNYKEAILSLDNFGIPESEVTDHEVE